MTPRASWIICLELSGHASDCYSLGSGIFCAKEAVQVSAEAVAAAGAHVH